MINIDNKLLELSSKPSDINQHLMTLKKYGENVKHITELGVRSGVSTWALLASRPETFISYDITDKWFDDKKLVVETAKNLNINYEFRIGDSLVCDIDETELLFIDTYHSYHQLEQELNKHSKNVKKYIILHDTVSFAYKDENQYDEISDIIKSQNKQKMGLKNALNDFLYLHKEWIIEEEFFNNNGLTVIKRI